MAKRLTKADPALPIKPEALKKQQLSGTEGADLVLHRYDETFRDLARYDRGEKPIDTISLL